MAWRRRRDSAAGEGGAAGEIEIFARENGLTIEGSPSAVTAFVDQMLVATKEVEGRARHFVVDGVQIAANVEAYHRTHREYLEFSKRAAELLKKHGKIPTDDGYFRSFVRNGREFAGNLDWKKVDLSPEQALSMQAAAGQLALRAAIKEITVALERIEGKIETLVELAEAERLGKVAGDRKTLEPLVDRVRSAGDLSATDWSTVASLGPLIARDVEAIRAYIVRQLHDAGDSPLVRSRADAAEQLTDRLLRESVALLVVAEDNYALWQELRLANAVNREGTATRSITADIREQLAALATADQELLDLLRGVSDRLSSPTGYEGFAPLQKRHLLKHVAELDEIGRWFSEQRNLDGSTQSRPDLADLRESIAKAGGLAADVARHAGRTIGQAPSRVKSWRTDHHSSDGPAELPVQSEHD